MRGDRSGEGEDCLGGRLLVNRTAEAHSTKEFFSVEKFHNEIINLTLSVINLAPDRVINHWL